MKFKQALVFLLAEWAMFSESLFPGKFTRSAHVPE